MITDQTLQRPAADAWAQALAQMPPHTASALGRLGRLRRWHSGDTVIQAGTVADALLLVLSGRLRMVAVSKQGHEVLFRWFAPGEFIGLVSIIGHVPVPTEAVAVGEVQAVAIEREALLSHLRGDAEGALHFAAIAAHFAAEMVELFVAQTTGSLSERILNVLWRLARHEAAGNNDGDVRLALSHQDIANAVGASRQRVSLELQKLVKRGDIQIGYRHLLLRHRNPPRR